MSKPKVAFFDFTSCEGCQLSKLNLEDDLLDILGLVDIVEVPRGHVRPRATTTTSPSSRGRISTPHCVERIHKIRRQAEGAGGAGRLRRTSAASTRSRTGMNIDEVQGGGLRQGPVPLPDSIKAQAVSAVVKVDYFVHGCPMDNQRVQAGAVGHADRARKSP